MRILLCLIIWLSSACSTPSKKVIAPYCGVNEGSILRKVSLPFSPKYFFKPVGQGDEVALVASLEQDQNVLFNLSTGQVKPIPGRLDPIGLFGQDLVSIPIENERGQLSLAFFHLNALRKEGVFAKPIRKPDSRLNGRYQSMAVLKETPAQIEFRVLTDGGEGGQYQDFSWNRREGSGSIQPIQNRPVTLCRNLRTQGILAFKLPMISKEGTEVSLFDLENQKMQFFKIQGTRCTPIPVDSILRGDVGKIDFAPGAENIAFHFSERSTDVSPLIFDRPQVAWHLRSALFSLKEKNYRLLPYLGPSTHTYFPAFSPRGTLITLLEEAGQFYFLEIDWKKARSVRSRSSAPWTSLQREQLSSLARYWSTQCTDEYESPSPEKFWIQMQSLSGAKCRRLIQDWAKTSPDTDETLLSAFCGPDEI